MDQVKLNQIEIALLRVTSPKSKVNPNLGTRDYFLLVIFNE